MPQQAWIQNATLRDNILFGKSFQSSNYHKIVKACALQQDFDMLPGGDMTEIGEKVVCVCACMHACVCVYVHARACVRACLS